jgi:hypothetical protein
MIMQTPQLTNSNLAFLVDGVSAVAIHNGVARIQFMRLNVDGKPVPTVELAVPVTQVRSIIEAFIKASKP